MKVTIARTTLLNALGFVGACVPAKSPKSALTGIRIDAADGRVRLNATNTEIAAQSDIAADVDEPGAVLIDAGKLASHVRLDESEHLTISTTANGCKVAGDRARIQVNTMNVDEFPLMETVEGDTLECNGTALAAGIRSVVSAIGEGERFTFSAVWLEAENDVVWLVCTDGRRVHFFQFPCKCGTKIIGLVPEKAATLMAKMADGCEEVSVTVNNSWISAETASSRFMARLGEGRFPAGWREYTKVQHDFSLTLNTEQFVQSIRIAMQADNIKQPGVLLQFGGGKLVASTESEIGEGVSEILIQETPKMDVRISGKYAIDAAKAAERDGQFEIRVRDGESPVQFIAPEFGGVVMPVVLTA